VRRVDLIELLDILRAFEVDLKEFVERGPGTSGGRAPALKASQFTNFCAPCGAQVLRERCA
jgi:hypothetical protein